MAKNLSPGVVTVIVLISLVVVAIVIAIAVIFGKPKPQDEGYSNDEVILKELLTRMVKINKSFAKLDIRVGNKSFSRDKRRVYLCIKNPETQEYFDMNTLMRVLLHEVAHLVADTLQHRMEFYAWHYRLLSAAEAAGVFNPEIPMNKLYCQSCQCT